MTNEQILKKAIDGAVRRGYTKEDLHSTVNKEYPALFNIIFSHSFAKAFWGEDIVCEIEECGDQGCYDHTVPDAKIGIANYLFRLKIMVQEEQPLKYIKKFI